MNTNNKELFQDKTTHPSYGMLAFRRRTGYKSNLFGSSIQHRDTIALIISHGSVIRELNTDWYTDEKPIIEVEMSYSQFAEAITSMNMGGGVPVTIRYTDTQGHIPECDFIHKRKQFKDELKTQLDNATELSRNLIRDVQDLFANKKTLNKTDKTDIINKLSQITSATSRNVDYIYNCFDEQMDKTITEAKGEIEAFYQNKLNMIAQAALVEHKDELISYKNPIEIPDQNTQDFSN